MALIQCPECASRVSDMAPVCPRCGYPIAEGDARYTRSGPPPIPHDVRPPIPHDVRYTHRETGTFGKAFGESVGSSLGQLFTCLLVIIVGVVLVVGITVVVALANHP